MNRGETTVEDVTGGALAVLVAGCAPHLLTDGELGPLLQRAGLKPKPRPGHHSSRAFEVSFGRDRFTLIVPRFDPDGVSQWLAANQRTVQTAPPTVDAIVDAAIVVTCQSVENPAETTLRALGKIVLLINAFLFPTHVCWLPAGLWSDAARFAKAVERSDEEGPLPLMHMVAFDPIEGGVVTRGLGAMTGQDLICNHEGGIGPAGTIRRLARLALDMIENGSVDRHMTVVGLVAGERITLEPAGEFVQVEIRPAYS